YGVGRVAFNRQAGLWGAAFIAVSPFGVYQSQEARHYTLPILLITLGLLCLLLLHRDLHRQKVRLGPWLGLVLLNSLGLYVHYFHFIALAAQGLTLLFILWLNRAFKLKIWILSAIAFGIPLLLYWPWWSVLLFHFNNPKASWLPEPNHITPILQMLLSVVLMIVAPPVERQPWAIMIGGVAIALVFAIWLLRQLLRGWPLLRRQYPETTAILSVFVLAVWGQFFVIIYGLGKDVSVAPRYNFVYFAALCVLFGACLQQLTPKQKLNYRGLLALAGGWVSSILTIYNLAFLKPYHPLPVATQLQTTPLPMLMVMGYHYPLDISLGLSYALALDTLQLPDEKRYVIFLDNRGGYEAIWQFLTLELPLTPQSVWIFGPGLIEEDYPASLLLSGKAQCDRDPGAYYRVGVPYQLYRCGRSPQL
ncbi:MAG: glycosyltransferase family 39 protein, partial [Jaaginema sp. PMC 1080.18]|nr:glycosyltransferase family 39 protein [Jaaginema sp. PMC 1080.18]